jgi:hypothetical protein
LLAVANRCTLEPPRLLDVVVATSGSRVEGAGSFLRTDSKGLDVVGKTFIVAVSQKYLETARCGRSHLREAFRAGNSRRELLSEIFLRDRDSSVQRFATASNFDVEVVLNNRVTDRFKQLGRLRAETARCGRSLLREAFRAGNSRRELLSEIFLRDRDS